MKTETKAIAREAAEIAMKETERLCKNAGLTKSKTLKRIKEGLDAHEVKATYDKDLGRFAYSKKLVSHGLRLKAAEIAMDLLNLKPPEKKQIDGELKLSHELSPELEELLERMKK